MVRIVYLLLCHKDPEGVIQQAERLTAAGDFVAIHFDASAPRQAFDRIQSALRANAGVALVTSRVKCGWGEWSLVQATLRTIDAALDAFPSATHFYLLSGDCMPIKSAAYMHDILARQDSDFVESEDFFSSDWIKTGWKEERLVYRHFVNERARPKLFYFLFEMQRRLGLRRAIPQDLEMMIGSQWWCLRRGTIDKIRAFLQERPDVRRFFRRTWIPDETFFQTLVRHLVAGEEIQSRTLTFLMFTDYGMPVTFYNDHYDLLLAQDGFFARKISAEAKELKSRLGALYSAPDTRFEVSNEGRKLFEFLTGRGRIGRRFAPRFWETESTLGRNRELLVLVCKKWHVAKRVLGRIRQMTNVPTLEYLFDEEQTPLPDLGGIHKTLEKRHRHKRSLVRMLFDYFETDRLVICLDPSNLAFLKDFAADRSTMRVLEIECAFSDSYLIGHATRMGLAGEATSQETFDRLLPTIRNDIMLESDRISDADLPYFLRLSERNPAEDMARTMARFLSLPPEKAAAMDMGPAIFAD